MEILAAPRDFSILEGTVIGSFGPPSITKYNFLKYRTPENHSINFIIQHQNPPSDLGKYKSHSIDDIVTLTKEGDELPRATPDIVRYTLEMVCSGQGNCERVCGASGSGGCGCSDAKDRKHACRAAVHISRTAQDIFDGKERIAFLHQHVSPPTVQEPPDAYALRPDQSITRQMVQSMTKGGVRRLVQPTHMRVCMCVCVRERESE